MDQERIGKFICELRKEKNMTQQELADKLNVTDRAVSHWENGRRLPDYSLLSELCEVLSVSINESNQVEISLSDNSKLTITDANGATALTDGLTFTSASQTAYTYDSESKTLVKKA